MKKVLFLSICLIVVSIFVIPELAFAKVKEQKVDKGPISKKVFIHYKKPRGKPDNPGKKPKPPTDDEGSYTYIANGMKWKTHEDYIFNPEGLPDSYTVAISYAMDAWDDEVESFSIFGSLGEDDSATVDEDIDEDNVIVFANLDDFTWINIGDSSNVIAVTIVWGSFNAPPRFREIVEVDMIFNTGSTWEWGHADDEGDPEMDVLNIATHEMGHAAGMGDLYDASASDETMFGLSSTGEIKKRDLHIGDIAGIQNLYE
ncbi:matrixin family metalloprotease [Planctomycetota bacterium]